MVLDDAQAMAPDERENVRAREVAEMLVPRARRSVSRLDVLRAAEHGEWSHLDEQEGAARLEEARHPGERLVEVEHMVQGAQAEHMIVARGLAVEVLDVADVQTIFRQRRAESGETLFVGVESRVGDLMRAQQCRQLVSIELLPATDVEHLPVQTTDMPGDPCFLPRPWLPSTRWNRRPQTERFGTTADGSGRAGACPLKSSSTPGAARSTKRWLDSDLTRAISAGVKSAVSVT
jgi:hypothetical protein